MKPIITNLTNEEYHHSQLYASHISSSQLKWYATSPAYYKYRIEHPELNEETPAMTLGSQFHDLMEGVVNGSTLDELRNGYAVFEAPINERTGSHYGESTLKYQEAYQQFLASADGKKVISQQSLDKIFGMAKAVLAKRSNSDLIRYAKPQEGKLKGAEISFFTKFEGVGLKCRADALTTSKIIDFKSCSCELTEDALSRQVINFGYDISTSFYQFVLYKITGNFYDFYWQFVTNKEPYESTVPVLANDFGFTSLEDLKVFEDTFDNDSMIFNRGVMAFKNLLKQHIYCMKNNYWPGSESFVEPDESGLRIMNLKCPSWAMNSIPKFYN